MGDAGRTLPTVSILVPVYGSEPFLEESILSALNQSYPKCELLVLFEDVTPETSEVLEDFRESYPTVNCYESGGGLTAALNEGIERCSGKYVARQDADDVSHERRIQRQVETLEARDNIGIVGSNITLMNPAGDRMSSSNYPTSDLAIRWKSLYRNPFAHSSVMMRRDLFAGDISYRSDYPAAEDYALWTTLLDSGKGANVPEPLVSYRVGLAESVSESNRTEMYRSHLEIATARLRAQSPRLDRRSAARLARFLHPRPERFTERELEDIVSSFSVIYADFVDRHGCNEEVRRHATLDFVSSLRKNDVGLVAVASVLRNRELLSDSPITVSRIVRGVCAKHRDRVQRRWGFDSRR